MRPLLLLLAGCATQPTWPEPPADAGSRDACAIDALPDDEVVLRMSHDDKARSALVWAGRSAGPRDVVVNLHEYRAEPKRQAHYSGWVPFAREIGAILVGPDGKSATWNAGGCCGRSVYKRINDVGFLDEMLTKIDASGCTSGKVLATGIGNGGMMAQGWACESDAVDAVISVGGALQVEACTATRPIPILHYHGSEDEFYPADGSKGHLPVEEALAIWRARNKATGEPVVETHGDLTCRTWEGEAPVRSCVVEGMHAMWPGAADTSIESDSPLADATRGGFAWIREHW